MLVKCPFIVISILCVTLTRCLYVSIVVAILLVSGGVLTAFFYPRNVDVSILSINSSADYINTLTALSKNNTDTAVLEIEVQIKFQQH